MSNNENLLKKYKFGSLELPNRIVMAPMTRNRAGAGDEPTELNAKYYEQRASAGLIFTEATKVSEQATAYPGTPGLYTPGQVAGWKRVIESVHEAGGRIFVQLWHGGRISHPLLQPNGAQPVAPSAIAAVGEVFTPEGMRPLEVPRALETGEIPGVVEQFRRAAELAREAGFDGIEVHGANGYLVDQFLRDGSNQREDEYGGSFENRSRFLLEVVDAFLSVWDAENVGVRLSPSGTFNTMSDSAPVELYEHVVAALAKKGIGYLDIVEPGPDAGEAGPGASSLSSAFFRARFKGTVIASGGYDRESGNAAIAAGNADLVAYARLYLANPDLPERFAAGADLNEPDPDTFYQGGERGYTDYPTL